MVYSLSFLLLFLTLSPSLAQRTTLYGLTSQGGKDGTGAIIEYDINKQALIDPAPTGFTNASPGRPDYNNLTEVNGKLYGLTYSGGAFFSGVLFEFNPINGVYTKKHDFASSSFPNGGLIEFNGKLYGTTSGGETNGGVIFEFDPVTVLYSEKYEFDLDGSTPSGGLVNLNGILFGLTFSGGSQNAGSIFSFDPLTATYSILHDFDGVNGSFPWGSLTVLNNVLYGTTTSGGTTDNGVLFSFGENEFTKVLEFTKLLDFSEGKDSNSQDDGGLTVLGGNLYGTRPKGGSSDNGFIFEYNPNSKTFFTFDVFDGANGSAPFGALTLFNGKLYGVTVNGGTGDVGVLFEFEPTTNSYIKKRDFEKESGSLPLGSLTEFNSRLYGMTTSGGKGDSGVIFEFNPITDAYGIRVDFNKTNGSFPSGSLTLFNGVFYGMAAIGGKGEVGVIFSFDPASQNYTPLVEFDGSNGAKPSGDLTLYNDKFYGMTPNGGANDQGLIFMYDPINSSFVRMANFDQSSASGGSPFGSLTVLNGKFYGLSKAGGRNNKGVVFEFDPVSGSFTNGASFEGLNGEGPLGSLVEFEGILYGMTTSGGANFGGVIFEYNPSSATIVKKFDFESANGMTPFGSLTVLDNKLYGLTSGGGAGNGVLFEFNPNTDTFSRKHSFSLASGGSPYGTLSAYGGKLWGMTTVGGSEDYGVVFEYDPANNSYLKTADFNLTNGGFPLYGQLTLFDATPAELSLSATKVDETCPGRNGSIDLTIAGATGTPVISWTGPDTFTADLEDLNNLAAGIYKVEVTDNLGAKGSLEVEILLTPDTEAPTAVSLGEVVDVEVNLAAIPNATNSPLGLFNISAQTFEAASTGFMSRIDVEIARTIEAGTITLNLYNGSDPNNPGMLLGTASFANVDATDAFVPFIFDSPITVTAGSSYLMTLTTTGNHRIQTAVVLGGDPYSGGTFYSYSINTNTLISSQINDLIFKTYVLKAGATTRLLALDATGNLLMNADDFDGGSSDNCGIADRSISPTSFSCNDLGSPKLVTLTVSDAAGNQSSASINVTVIDPFGVCNQPPVAVAKPLVLSASENCQAVAVATDFDGGSTDPEGDVLSFSIAPLGPYDLGVTNVILTVTNSKGASSTATTTVTVKDDTAPVPPSAPEDLTLQCASEVPPPMDLTASDNCSGSITASPTIIYYSDEFPLGSSDLDLLNLNDIFRGSFEEVRTWTFFDAAGNSSSVSQTIIVKDITPPVAPPVPADVTVECEGDVPAPVDLTFTDNCEDGTTRISPIITKTYDANGVDFTEVRTWTFTDPSGNTTSVSQNIRVEDTTPPVLVLQDVTVIIDPDGTANGNALNNGAIVQLSDNCGINRVGGTGSSTYTCGDLGSFTVTVTAFDDAGNQTSGDYILTVTDPNNVCNEAPVAVAQSLTISADANCQGTATAADFDGGSTDANGDELSFSVSPAGPYPLGVTNVSLTVDDGNGGSSTASTTITVVDNTAPIVTVPDDITVSNDAGQCGATVTYTVGISDDCDPSISYTASHSSGSFFPLGTTTVTVDATDAAGNKAIQKSFTVTVIDAEAPVITAIPASRTQNNDPGQCGIIIDFSAFVSDNCPGTTISYSQEPNTLFPIGTTIVTVDAVDAAGNKAKQESFTITVVDAEAPVIKVINPTPSAVLGLTNTVTLQATDIFAATDNCSDVVFSPTVFTFDCDNIGDNNVSVSVTDAAGNTANANATVTINDNAALSIDASDSGTPVPIGSDAVLKAIVSPATGGLEVTFSLDGVEKGIAITDGSGVATLTLDATGLGSIPVVYKVSATIQECSGLIESVAYLPIYDPNGNFVTGGGWIMSPERAYKADESLAGKANFGFVSKYKKGSNRVDGNTEFEFHAGGLYFKSTLHESGSLVISGRKATYRGEGTVNDIPGYKFTLVALDGNWNGGTDPDQFRIKIWGPTGIVYDNGLGADDNSDASTVLGGGAITIHTPKGKGNKREITDPTAEVMNNLSEEIGLKFSQELKPGEFLLYPNPAHEETSVMVDLDQEATVAIRIFDATGRLVLENEELRNGSFIQTFDLDGLASGLYTVQVKTGVIVMTKRLIKK
ncbi:choice-of-anchor tandem repeat GloVer-containing protein [Algoriphagus faecimaris]|nr:choice-of-anchor tandem repeat GloVer-containing protein [Algoriphagus faecimaris]